MLVASTSVFGFKLHYSRGQLLTNAAIAASRSDRSSAGFLKSFGHDRGTRLLNPLYLPFAEVASDAYSPRWGIAFTHIQLRYAIDVLARFKVLKAHDPHDCKMQWVRQPPSHSVRIPLSSTRV